MAEIKEGGRPHTLMLENRKVLSLTGITDVSGFDEQTVNLKTQSCSLVVKGEKLHISKLSLETGDVCIDGEISSLQYLSVRAKSIKSRLFR